MSAKENPTFPPLLSGLKPCIAQNHHHTPLAVCWRNLYSGSTLLILPNPEETAASQGNAFPTPPPSPRDRQLAHGLPLRGTPAASQLMLWSSVSLYHPLTGAPPSPGPHPSVTYSFLVVVVVAPKTHRAEAAAINMSFSWGDEGPQTTFRPCDY